MIQQSTLNITSSGRQLIEITHDLNPIVNNSNITTGLCHLFIMHTSASLVMAENADDTVKEDMEGFMGRLVIDGDPHYRHVLEGPDDMAAHLRTMLTNTSLTIPVSNYRLMLGTWQGIYLWEHRYQSHLRKIIVSLSD